MKIVIASSSSLALYEQIVEQIKENILTGVLTPGSPLPSIRSLARELQLSVITTKRAYEELERAGYVETIPGKGTFVSGQNPDFIRDQRLQQLEQKLTDVIKASRQLNLSRAQLEELLRVLYEEV